MYIDGDDANLPKILDEVWEIDIFHYDSDKTYSGRKSAMSIVEKSMSKNGIILMDDIQDNSFFYDFIEKSNPSTWYIFDFLGKYVGMAGKLC